MGLRNYGKLFICYLIAFCKMNWFPFNKKVAFQKGCTALGPTIFGGTLGKNGS